MFRKFPEKWQASRTALYDLLLLGPSRTAIYDLLLLGPQKTRNLG